MDIGSKKLIGESRATVVIGSVPFVVNPFFTI